MHTLNGIDNVGGCNSVWSRFSRILNYITYDGGFISVFITLNQLVFETELRNRDYVFYGLTRILVSILAGLFVL